MQLDKNAIAMLLSLDDARLMFIINHMAASVGIDTEYFGLKQQDIATVRQKLSSLTEADLAEAQRQINAKGGR